jgi:hypothetical protein
MQLYGEQAKIREKTLVANRTPRAFIAEDSVLISLDLEKILIDYGYQIAGQAGSVANSLEIIGASEIDFAFINYRLGDGTSEPISEALISRAIPYAFCTGQSGRDFPKNLSEIPVIQKPFVPDDIRRTVKHLIGK